MQKHGDPFLVASFWDLFAGEDVREDSFPFRLGFKQMRCRERSPLLLLVPFSFEVPIRGAFNRIPSMSVRAALYFMLCICPFPKGGDVDKNVMKIASKFPGQPLVLTSALAECFLQKLHQQVRHLD